jgi:hypothetical protein
MRPLLRVRDGSPKGVRRCGVETVRIFKAGDETILIRIVWGFRFEERHKT